MTFEAWREIMSISLDGSFHCIKACLPSMIENKGRNIGTLGGDGALPDSSARCTAPPPRTGSRG